MNIQAEKLELVRMILDTDNPSILASIKRIFTSSKKVDFWDSLTQSQKEEILKGIEEIENGKPIIAKIQVTIKPEVVLGDYKGIEIEKAEYNVTDEHVEDELKSVPSVKLGLGSENPELWDDLGLDKTAIHSGIVYQ